jgi:hypothetical protein
LEARSKVTLPKKSGVQTRKRAEKMDHSSEDAWDERVRSVEKRQIQTSSFADEF